MSLIAKTLKVSRSNLCERLNNKCVVRPKQYSKDQDGDILSTIKSLCHARASYGYRGITALINRQREQDGFASVNHKRIYRIMRNNRLLLQRYTGKSTKLMMAKS